MLWVFLQLLPVITMQSFQPYHQLNHNIHSNNQPGIFLISIHHCGNKDEFTKRLGLLPLNKAITQTLSLSSAVRKIILSMISIYLLFWLKIPNAFIQIKQLQSLHCSSCTIKFVVFILALTSLMFRNLLHLLFHILFLLQRSKFLFI